MSLKQFLAVGRSVVGMRQERSPYAMRAATLLPRFKSGTRSVDDVQVVVAEEFSSPKSKGSGFWKRLNPFRSKKSSAGSGGAEKEATVFSQGGKGRSIFRKSFFPARGRKKGDAAKPVRTLIQSELSLDTVRVVRNDLSDTDLEIVACFRQREAGLPLQTPLIKKAEPAATLATAASVEPSEFAKAASQRGWSRLTARLFDTSGVGRV